MGSQGNGLEVNQHTAAPSTEISEDKQAVTGSIAQKLLPVLKQAADDAGIVHVSLTGGSAGIAVLEALAELVRRGDESVPTWESVHFWWGDERLLPAGDQDRNETQARAALLDYLVAEQGLPETNIHPMPTSEQAANPEAGAMMYAQELEACAPECGIDSPHGPLNIPQFEVVLLGVGPDGHINSLFPGKDSLQVTGRSTTGEEDAPAELGPPLRVTLTFDAVHTAKRVWTGVTGGDKAEAAAQALAADPDVNRVPAANARGLGETIWHLDTAAAAQLG